MPEHFIDRGTPIQGIERTARDNRVPPNVPRSLVNLSLPDQRLVRRPGFQPHGRKITRQILAKHTGVSLLGRTLEEEEWKSEMFRTPLSYGLLRWHDDYQPKSTRDWTIEFGLRLGDKEELVIDPFSRRSNNTVGSTFDFVIREPGVYVYDQTILANQLDINVGTVASPGTTHAIARQIYDVYPTTALAIGYNESKLFVNGSVVQLAAHTTPGLYYPNAYTLQHTLSTYTPGDFYHIAVTYDSATRALKFYVNGSLANSVNTFTMPANTGFPGEYDDINGIVNPLQRDIVLLNECTVRASYASSCHGNNTNIMHNYQTFYHSYEAAGGTDDPAVPWACSPPRGTGMLDLRIWHQELSSAEILANIINRESAVATTNLKGSWPLDDGGQICRMWRGVPRFTTSPQDITIHHGYPGYVEKGLHNLSLRFADGQHLRLSSRVNFQKNYTADWPVLLNRSLSFDPAGSAAGSERFRVQGKHDFTVQVQISLPPGRQQEINKHVGSDTQTELINSAGVVTRDRMQYGGLSNKDNYFLTDGEQLNSETPLLPLVGVDNAGSTAAANRQTHRAYDQTIFSFEGTGGVADPSNPEGFTDRKPIVRGLIDPDGYVIFELYKSQGTHLSTGPVLYRLRSTTQLAADKTYVITFVQRVKESTSGIPPTLATNKFDIEIWIWDETAAGAKPTTPDSSRSFDATWVSAATSYRTSPYSTVGNWDVLIGASYVQSGWDASISAPLNLVGGVTTTTGPWKVPQHFMSPYQDQPLFADIGYFRLWTNALNAGGIEEVTGVSISQQDYSQALLFNLEIQEISGTRIKNKSRYPLFFEMGYKSWGTPQGYQNKGLDPTISLPNGMPHYKAEMFPGAWTNEDSLGWMAFTNEFYNNKQAKQGEETVDVYTSTEVRGLAPFQSTLTQSFGLMAVFQDAVVYDESIEEEFQDLFLHSGGVMSEFVAGEIWRGTPIGERTILTSRGGTPKVFNGKNLTYAGFKPWSGGTFSLESAPPTSVSSVFGADGGLTVGKFFGVAIVYFDETDSIFHVSPRQVLKLEDTTATGRTLAAIRVANIPAHYDPRVTSIRIHRTLEQESFDLAEVAPLFPHNGGAAPNLFLAFGFFTGADDTLPPAPLDLKRTEFPQCQYGASYNGRLWLAGDPLIPDAVYFSLPGNPEAMDRVDNFLIVEEGSGDKITGLVAMFGALFVFKINSIWRIADIGGNQFQVDNIASVGAVSDRSLMPLTIPDSGRNAIFFWSQHGPYLYDGATVQYIGRPIEEQDQTGEALAEYAWLDPKTTITLHDIRRREIIVIHRPKFGVPRVASQDYSDAVVFNYRARAWYRYKGVIGTVALSQSFTGGTYVGFFGSAPVAPPESVGESSAVALAQPNRNETNVYHAFLGGSGGQLYKWAEAREDGISDDERTAGFGNPYTVTSFSQVNNPYECTITAGGSGHVGNRSLSDLWVTFQKPGTKEFFTVKIEEATSAGTTILLKVKSKTISSGTYPFVPTNGDSVYIAQTPAEVEFPWDSLAEAVPGLQDDKTVQDLVTWMAAVWLWRYAVDFKDNTLSSFQTVADGNGKQNATTVNVACEAFKLFLYSLELESRVDSYGFTVKTTRKSARVK